MQASTKIQVPRQFSGGIGGGGSHRRTRLRFGIPCFAGKYREFLPLEADAGDAALPFSNKFKAFLPNSLRIETGNFAD
jgi:hypothetical protein